MNGADEPFLKLRTFKHGDLRQVVAIENSSFPDPYPSELFLWFKLKAGDGFIVALKEKVVGYAISEVRGERGHIVSMAVSQESRGEGIGAALLQESLKRLEFKVKEAYLEVRGTNNAAMRLYERFSFKKTGEVRNRYYPNGDDAIIMRRTLDSYGS